MEVAHERKENSLRMRKRRCARAMREFQEILFAYDVILRVKRYIFETLVPIEIHFANNDDAVQHNLQWVLDVSMQSVKKHKFHSREQFRK